VLGNVQAIGESCYRRGWVRGSEWPVARQFGAVAGRFSVAEAAGLGVAEAFDETNSDGS
jgi:hypothetical protein